MRILDPFAGIGLITSIPGIEAVCLEIEKDWATQVCGNALMLPFKPDSFDAIATSVTYGNRMADHHNAKDGSKRITYRHVLGHELHPFNSGRMQWGPAYRGLHWWFYAMEMPRVLRPNGLVLINVKDHYRNGSRIHVTVWHFMTLWWRYQFVDWIRVPVTGMGFGANGKSRVPYESVLVFRRK